MEEKINEHYHQADYRGIIYRSRHTEDVKYTEMGITAGKMENTSGER